LRLSIDPYVVGVPFIMFYPAVIVVTLISGLGAGPFLRRAQFRSRRVFHVAAQLVFLH
jgi:hypothetical protein